MLKATACEQFKAKIMPYFDSNKIDVLPLHIGDKDKIVVGYTQFEESATAFMRFVVDDIGGRVTIGSPFTRCMEPSLKFNTIIADDEGQALDKLADWFIENKEAITQPKASWHAY